MGDEPADRIVRMSPVSSGAFEPAPVWAIFWAVVVGFGGLVAFLIRIRTVLSAIRDGGSRIEQWAVQAEERARLEIVGHGGVRRAARVDGWLDPPLACPSPDRPGDPPTGVMLHGRVTNRSKAPVWDVLAEIVDPRTGQALPLIPLVRHVLPPGQQWSLEWIAGCAVTAPGDSVVIDLTESARSRRNGMPPQPLPLPAMLVEAGTVRPQLRITFSDTAGRWARLGAWVAPVTRDHHHPPGSAALSRAADEFREAETEGRPLDTARVAIEVGLAVHEVARHRLGRFSDSPLDLSALPRLLTSHPIAHRLRFTPGTSFPAFRGAPAGAPAPAPPDGGTGTPAPADADGTAPSDTGAVAPAPAGTTAPADAPAPVDSDASTSAEGVAALASAVRRLDERIGAASDRGADSARLLLAHAGSVLTALNGLRLGPEPVDPKPVDGPVTAWSRVPGGRFRDPKEPIV